MWKRKGYFMVYSAMNNYGAFDVDDIYSQSMMPSLARPSLAQHPSYGINAGPSLEGHPRSDAFMRHEGEESGHSSGGWKKFFGGALVGGLTVFGLNKYKPGWLSSLVEKFSFGSKKAAETAKKTAKEKAKMKAEILEELGETKKTKKVAAGAKDTGKIAETFKGIPRWGKIAGGVVIGALALVGIGKWVSNKSNKEESENIKEHH